MIVLPLAPTGMHTPATGTVRRVADFLRVSAGSGLVRMTAPEICLFPASRQHVAHVNERAAL